MLVSLHPVEGSDALLSTALMLLRKSRSYRTMAFVNLSSDFFPILKSNGKDIFRGFFWGQDPCAEKKGSQPAGQFCGQPEGICIRCRSVRPPSHVLTTDGTDAIMIASLARAMRLIPGRLPEKERGVIAPHGYTLAPTALPRRSLPPLEFKVTISTPRMR